MKKRTCVVFAASVMMFAATALNGCAKPADASTTEAVSEAVTTEAVTTEAATTEAVTEESSAETEAPATAETEAPAEERSFSEWEGTWNSLDTYLDDSGLTEAYEELATRESSTADEILAGFKERYKSEIVSMKIEGDKLTIYSETQGSEAEADDAATQITYHFTTQMPTEMGFSWNVFETEEETDYPVLMLIDVGEDEPGVTMRHFHFRYGTSVDDLFAIDGWYPTMVKSDSTIDLIANDFTLEED